VLHGCPGKHLVLDKLCQDNLRRVNNWTNLWSCYQEFPFRLKGGEGEKREERGREGERRDEKCI
jgi:hypothetical protein